MGYPNCNVILTFASCSNAVLRGIERSYNLKQSTFHKISIWDTTKQLIATLRWIFRDRVIREILNSTFRKENRGKKVTRFDIFRLRLTESISFQIRGLERIVVEISAGSVFNARVFFCNDMWTGIQDTYLGTEKNVLGLWLDIRWIRISGDWLLC